MVEPETAPLPADMRAEQARPRARARPVAPQFLARPVRRLPRVVLIGKDPLLHETLGTLLQLDEVVG